jgi:hypothetical protein
MVQLPLGRVTPEVGPTAKPEENAIELISRGKREESIGAQCGKSACEAQPDTMEINTIIRNLNI